MHENNIVERMKFPIKDLVTFTEEILNGKLHFLCSVIYLSEHTIHILLFKMPYASPKKVHFRLFVHWEKFVIDLPLQKS